VFSEPTSRRVHNIGQRPLVTLHFNSDPHGGDFWVISGTVTIRHGVEPSSAPGYIDKYRASIKAELRASVEAIDATSHTQKIGVYPIKVRTT